MPLAIIKGAAVQAAQTETAQCVQNGNAQHLHVANVSHAGKLEENVAECVPITFVVQCQGTRKLW